jgi:hypothetical protein
VAAGWRSNRDRGYVRVHLGESIMVDSVIAVCWRSQVLIISAALSGKKRVEMGGFYLFLAIMLTIGFAAIRFTRP